MCDAQPAYNDTSDTEKKISAQACNVLNELRKSGQLCDATIKLENGSFPVHRAIMSACSPYFRALFTNGMEETNMKEVFIPDVTSEMMELIIDYAYTRENQVTGENVELLLPVADQFHVLGLVKACCNFLKSEVTPENVLGIRNFAKHYFCSSLERYAHRYAMEHFTEIAQNQNEILQLSLTEMMELISSEELNVRSEETVFDCVLRWINHDPDGRKQNIVPLMKCVRLGLLSTTYFLENVKVVVCSL